MSLPATHQNIRDYWECIEAEFPDKSTPWLMQMVCDRGRQCFGWRIDHGDVSTALLKTRKPSPQPAQPAALSAHPATPPISRVDGL